MLGCDVKCFKAASSQIISVFISYFNYFYSYSFRVDV